MRILGLLVALLLFAGCNEHMVVDRIPPSAPQGIRATALDNAADIRWLPNTEPDVAGYNVWVSDRYDGTYKVVARTSDEGFLDYGVVNGVRVFYGVTAFDYDGNESELSRDVVYVTPRPEGYGTRISNYRISPDLAGYDFSTYSVGNYRDDYTDLFFEFYNGQAFFNVWDDTDIQDMGYTGSLYDVSVAPASGWAPSKSVEAIPGHTYIVWTWDDHFAKFRIREVTSTRVTIDWAYQIDGSNPDLKREVPAQGTRLLKPRLEVRIGT
jgi:hypothetical protein